MKEKNQFSKLNFKLEQKQFRLFYVANFTSLAPIKSYFGQLHERLCFNPVAVTSTSIIVISLALAEVSPSLVILILSTIVMLNLCGCGTSIVVVFVVLMLVFRSFRCINKTPWRNWAAGIIRQRSCSKKKIDKLEDRSENHRSTIDVCYR